MLNVYLDGERQGESLVVSISSSTVIFVLNYCELTNVRVVLVRPECIVRDEFVTLPDNCVSKLTSATSVQRKDLFVKMSGCAFPAVKDEVDNFIRCGLCSTLRFLVLYADQNHPTLHLKDILGFRGGTLRSCSEVSSWTRLCEVDIPQAVESVRQTLRCSSPAGNSVIEEVPVEIQRLEVKLNQPTCHHNNDKIKQDVLRYLRKNFSRSFLQSLEGLNDKSYEEIVNVLQKDIVKHHCLTKFTILKCFNGSSTKIPERKKRSKKPSASRRLRIAQRLQEAQDNATSSDTPEHDRKTLPANTFTEESLLTSHIANNNISKSSVDCQISIQHLVLEESSEVQLSEQTSATGSSFTLENALSDKKKYLNVSKNSETSSANEALVDCVLRFLNGLTAEHIELEHTYLEGIDLTLCDLLLFVYIYYFLESLQTARLSSQLVCPSLHRWFNHMMTLTGVKRAMDECGISVTTTTDTLQYKIELVTAGEILNQEDIHNNTKRQSNEKCRPIKPDVANALEKIKSAKIVPDVGMHPSGEDIHLPWGEFPTAVCPVKGESPKGRGQNKCEQIENLVSAVIKMSHPGDVIVDFCCGGGHLGIVIAYVLPNCKVFLIDNKEDSLMRAKERTDKLGLSNVTLFQCNLEYFNGRFDIGVCLHGCGVATDMVLQKCLDNMASFVVCPCCYGKVQNTHMITYPRSQEFREAQLTSKEYVILGHAADQTEIGIEQEQQGRYCSNLVDTDRGLLFKRLRFTVTLCSLQPLTCTTKNNLLIGVKPRINFLLGNSQE